MLCCQRVGQFIQIAVHDSFQFVQGQIDPVIRNPTLRIIIGTNPLAPVPRSHQTFSRSSFFRLLLAYLGIPNPRNQHRHGLGAVFMLAAVILAFNYNPSRQVCNSDGRVRFIDMLASGAGSTKSINAKLSRIDLHLRNIICFRHNGHRTG